MFEGLNAIPWTELTHAYGSAEEVPMWLRQLRSPDAETRHHALNHLWGAICHQNWIAPATGYAVPYLIELLADPEKQDKDEILNLLADIATCAPLHEPDWRENERVPTWNVPARIPFKDAILEAEKGIGVYLALLQSDDAKIRMSTTNLLTAFPSHRDELYPTLLAQVRQAGDPSERANAILALGKLAHDLTDGANLFQGLFQTEQNDLIRFAAALALTRLANEGTPQEVADVLAEVMERGESALKEYQELPCGGGWASGAARRVLYRLKSVRMRFLLPYLLRMIVDPQREIEWNDALEMLLYIVFDGQGDPGRFYEKPARPVRPAETLTPEQREILTLLCAPQFDWLNTLGNAHHALSTYDLPRNQKDLADYLGLRLPEQAPQELKPALRPQLPSGWNVAASARSELVREVLPELKISSWRSSSKYEGQNNAIYMAESRPLPHYSVASEYIFRFPQNQGAIAALEGEVALLRTLQERLPIAIPNPLFTLLEPREVGQVFMGYERIPGKPFYREMLESVDGAEAVQGLAAQLGGFLKALHALGQADFAFPLQVTNSRETWIAFYDRVTRLLLPKMRPDARDAVTRHFESYLARTDMWDWTPVLIHGDFGPGNILYDASRRAISGVIDFSGAGLGDPATDFAALSSPVSYKRWFVELIAEIFGAPKGMLDRTAFYIGTFALQEALHGLDTGDSRAYDAGMKEYL
jgi:aminoglycoside 2''-phosphotransferase